MEYTRSCSSVSNKRIKSERILPKEFGAGFHSSVPSPSRKERAVIFREIYCFASNAPDNPYRFYADTNDRYDPGSVYSAANLAIGFRYAGVLMFGFSLSPAIFLYSHPADMRKNFDGLAGLVTTYLRKDPMKDGAFVFVNKRRDRMKILLWDRHGFWLLYKRLEAGRFQIPPQETDRQPDSLALAYEQLLMIIEGIDLLHIKRRRRYEISQLPQINT